MRLVDRNAQTNRWRKISAIEKVVLSFGMMTLALCSPSWLVQGLVLSTMLLMLYRGACVPLGDVSKSISVPAAFITAGTLAQILTVSFVGFWPTIGLAPDYLWQALFVGLRSLACVSCLLFLALTTPLTDILRLLRRVGLSKEISDIALVMFRFIWLTLDCVERGRQSQMSRLGYCGYRRTLQSTGMLLANLLPRVLARAQRVEAGMASRGYEGALVFMTREEPVSKARMLGALTLPLAIWAIGRIVPSCLS